MTSRAERRRRRHRKAVERFHELAAVAQPEIEIVTSEPILRPTDERMAHGVWHIANRNAPAVDRTGGDMLGELYATGQIEKPHFDAGRAFQALCDAFTSDMGVKGFRSCLDMTGGGYDATDGSEAIAKAYDRLKHKLGAVRFAYLRTELSKPAGAKCKSVEMLRRALESC
jgi:hypothetical protein